MPKLKVKDQWAAVLWDQENGGKKDKKDGARFCDVINLTCIPTKYRTEGSVASLKWLDASTGKTSYHKAKVLKIDSNKEALELLCINSNTGEIADPSQKTFSYEVLNKKKEQQQIKKVNRAAKSKAGTEVSTEIEQDTSIFEKIGMCNTRPRLFETAPPSTSFQPTYTAEVQERPSFMMSNEFSASLPTSSENYANNSYTPFLFLSNASENQKLPSTQPSAAREFESEFPLTAQPNAVADPKPTAILNYVTSSQPVTTFSAAATENVQQFSTTVASHLPIPEQQYRYKLTTQELQQSVHGSTPHLSQSNEPLQSPCSQLSDSLQSKCTSKIDARKSRDQSNDVLQRFMDAFAALAPEVTESNITFFENVVTAMKSTYLSENLNFSKDTTSKDTFKISEFYRTPGKGKVEIYPGTNFYFYEGIKENILDKSKVLDQKTAEYVNHWPILVRHALVEVYGKDLASFSAKGSKKDGRPCIDPQFYKALYYWACDWNGSKIDEQKYIDSINKAAFNKRKARNQSKGTLKNKSSGGTVTTSQEEHVMKTGQEQSPHMQKELHQVISAQRHPVNTKAQSTNPVNHAIWSQGQSQDNTRIRKSVTDHELEDMSSTSAEHIWSAIRHATATIL